MAWQARPPKRPGAREDNRYARKSKPLFCTGLAGGRRVCLEQPRGTARAFQRPAPSAARAGRVVLRWLRAIPGVGRLRALRPGADAQVGVLIDAFAAFATLDGELSPLEADLILDMLRSAFPEVDHGWLGRRLQRAVRNPAPLQSLAVELKNSYDDSGKLALGPAVVHAWWTPPAARSATGRVSRCSCAASANPSSARRSCAKCAAMWSNPATRNCPSSG